MSQRPPVSCRRGLVLFTIGVLRNTRRLLPQAYHVCSFAYLAVNRSAVIENFTPAILVRHRHVLRHTEFGNVHVVLLGFNGARSFAASDECHTRGKIERPSILETQCSFIFIVTSAAPQPLVQPKHLRRTELKRRRAACIQTELSFDARPDTGSGFL